MSEEDCEYNSFYRCQESSPGLLWLETFLSLKVEFGWMATDGAPEALLDELEMEKLNRSLTHLNQTGWWLDYKSSDQCFGTSILHVITVNQVRDRDTQLISLWLAASAAVLPVRAMSK